MVYIETPRLILRDWKEEDFIPFAEMNGNPSVMEFFLSGTSFFSTDMADMPLSKSPMEPLWVLRVFITLCLMWTLLRVLRYCGD